MRSSTAACWQKQLHKQAHTTVGQCRDQTRPEIKHCKMQGTDDDFLTLLIVAHILLISISHVGNTIRHTHIQSSLRAFTIHYITCFDNQRITSSRKSLENPARARARCTSTFEGSEGKPIAIRNSSSTVVAFVGYYVSRIRIFPACSTTVLLLISSVVVVGGSMDFLLLVFLSLSSLLLIVFLRPWLSLSLLNEQTKRESVGRRFFAAGQLLRFWGPSSIVCMCMES